MEHAAQLINSVAALLWPVIAIVVVCLFRPALAALIDSAKSRKFSLKFGGQELTMEEANEQQRFLISDLQAQMVELRKKIEGTRAFVEKDVPSEVPFQAPPANAILWVDDSPKNNSYFVEQITKVGIRVDLATSTAEGIARFDKGSYQCVISDMGRTEEGQYKAKAGLELLRIIRSKNPTMPFIIFCSSRGVRDHEQEAHSLGVTAITSSPTDLFGLLNLERAKAQ